METRPEGPAPIPKQIDEELKHKIEQAFQINSHTELSSDFFNELAFFKGDNYKMLLFPDKIPEFLRSENPEVRAEMEVSQREGAVSVLRRLPTYTEWVHDWIKHPLYTRRFGEIPADVFISDKTRERVDALDKKIEEMRQLAKDNPKEIDLARLNQLALEAALLVYGDEAEKDLRESFTGFD